MSQLRLNPLTGRWVTVAVDRASRPGELISRQVPVEADPQRQCPFCPGNEESTPPALETYGPSGNWLVRVVPNLFPAFEGNEPLRVQNLGPVFTQASASGVHEVLVFSPDHTGSWADLDDKQAGLAMAAIRDRMEDHAGRSTVRYTQAIVNAGREAGASLEHPHGQLLGLPFVPGEIAEEEGGFRRFGGGSHAGSSWFSQRLACLETASGGSADAKQCFQKSTTLKGFHHSLLQAGSTDQASQTRLTIAP